MSAAAELAMWSHGVAALIAGALGAHLVLGWRGGQVGGWLIAVLGLSAVWAVLVCVAAIAPGAGARALAQVAYVGRFAAACALIAACLGGVRQFAGFMVVAYGLAILALALIAATVWAPGWALDRAVSRVFLGLAVSGLCAVEQLWRNVPHVARWGLKPLCLGLAAGFAFDVYAHAEAALLGRATPDAFAVRGFVVALCAPLFWLYGVRNPGLRLAVTVSRRVVFHSAALAACGAYLLLMSAAGFYVRDFGGRWGPALQLLLVFAGALLLVVIAGSGAVRAWLRVRVARHFFRLRYDYRDVWLGVTRALSQAASAREAGSAALASLAELVDAHAGVVWWSDDEGDFAPLATLNLAPSAARLPGPMPACAAEVRDLDHGASGLPAAIDVVPQARLWVPLVVAGHLKGGVVLGALRAGLEFNWEVRDALATAAAQAAGDIGHWQAFEALLSARRFEATSRMGTYVLHDLKNRVAELSLLLDNATRHGDNPAFQADMLRTVSHTVEALRALIENVRAAGQQGAAQSLALAPMLSELVASHAHRQPAPTLQVTRDATVRADVTTLARALGHLVQNAIDATAPAGRVWINLTCDNDSARIEIGDTGAGMSPQFVRERLFKPFQTTKPQGMGIGAFESQQTIRDLGGRIEVDSRLGEGSRFTVWLPLARAAQAVSA